MNQRMRCVRSGLGVRGSKGYFGHAYGVDESCTAFIAELAYLASLVGIFDGDERIMPSNKFDIWLMQITC